MVRSHRIGLVADADALLTSVAWVVSRCVAISPQASWRVIDGELVAYLAQSAETHLLSSPAAWVLSTLDAHGPGRSLTIDRLVDAAIADRAGVEPADPTASSEPPAVVDLSTNLAPLIDSLIAIGVLAEVPC